MRRLVDFYNFQQSLLILEQGIVLVKCPGCNNRHLIADNLGWFKQEATNDGKLKNVEDLVKAKGEHVRRGTITGDEIHYE